MSFIVNIFNNLLKLNETEIMIIFDKDNNIWFKYRNILEALEYNDIDHRINEFNINDISFYQ